MPSSERRIAVGCLAFLLLATNALSAAAQVAPVPARGFAVERLSLSAPGGGWFVMDDLDLHGGLAGAVSVTGSYARDSLVVTDPSRRLPVVANQAFFDVGAAVTYDRFRLYLNLENPLEANGESGTVANATYTAPALGLGSNPDTISDVRLGFDARLFGDRRGPFRLGASAQLIVPSGASKNDDYSSYLTDGTYRVMLRLLFAGNAGIMSYAGYLGVHLRPLSEATLGSPQGSELMVGVAGGPRLPLVSDASTVVVVGPEIFGETAFDSFLGKSTTGLEALLTGRVEGAGDGHALVRGKLGIGGGLAPEFGAPEWRVVVSVELFEHTRTP